MVITRAIFFYPILTQIMVYVSFTPLNTALLHLKSAVISPWIRLVRHYIMTDDVTCLSTGGHSIFNFPADWKIIKRILHHGSCFIE